MWGGSIPPYTSMATTNIELDIENITGVSDADDQYIKTAQKFVVSSVPKELMLWAGTSTAVGSHGGDSSPTAITLPQPTDNIIDVQRNGFSAKQVPESMQGFIANSSSLHLATETYPKYYMQAGNKVIVKPDPSDSETALVNYVDFLKVDDDSDLRGAVIFHAAAQEFTKLATSKVTDWSDVTLPVAPGSPSFDTGAISVSSSAPTYTKPSLVLKVAPSIDDLSISAVSPAVPSISTVSYSDASNADASVTGVTTATASAPSIINVASSAPAYTKPSLTSRVSFNSFFESGSANPFDDSDPGVFSISAVPPSSPSISTVTYSDATNADASNADASNADASASTVAAVTVGTVAKADISGHAPAYNKPTVTSQTSFANYWTVGDFGDSDPGPFGLVASPPATPSAPSFSTPAVSAVTIGALPGAPNYTAPVFTSASTYLTEMEAGTLGASASDIDAEHWFSIAGQLIEDEEDTELAAVHLQKINTFISAFQSDMQNQLNIFNEGNAVYQASIQRNIEQARINAQDAQQEANLKLQEENQEYASTLQKYQADVSKYQAEVGKEVQEYTQKLSRYQLELNTVFQAWQKTESDNLQIFNSDIQNELNEYNANNDIYQANIQAEIAKHNSDLQKVINQAQIDAQDAQREADLATDVSKFNKQQDQSLEQFNKQQDQALDQFNKSQDQVLALTNAAKQMEDLIADNNSKLQKYSNDLQKYQSEVNDEVQQYSQKLSRYTMEADKVYNAWAKTESDTFQQYQLDIQNELNEFNRENSVYQIEFQEAVDKNQADLQVAVANANNLAQEYRQEAQQSTEMDKFNKSQDQALNLANAAKQIEDLIADNNSKIQKYSSELQSYQAEVSKEVQQYAKNLEKELNIWQSERQTDLQKYQSDIQNELNKFNKEQAVFQNELQEKVQEATNQQTKDSTEYGAKLQKYGQEIQSYQADVNEEIQKVTSSTQNAAYYSNEAKKYYEWAVAEVNMYVQNNSKMINRTIAAQAAQR